MKRLLAAFTGIIGGLAIAYGLAVGGPVTAPLSDRIEIEALTWVELRELVRHGKTTAIVPTGGVEQNGPHMVLGKHNYIVRHTAAAVARRLGDALVAPVVAYVPQGDIDPPTGHMRFPGTLSVPTEVFEQILEHTARSLRAHGFRTVLFLGDSGGNQAAQMRVAERLDAAWRDDGVRVFHIGDYYAPEANGQIRWLEQRGESRAAIGTHAGIRDTSELLAVHPDGMHMDRAKPHGGYRLRDVGVNGDPSRAGAEIGHALIDLKVDAAVRQIQVLMSAGPAGS